MMAHANRSLPNSGGCSRLSNDRVLAMWSRCGRLMPMPPKVGVPLASKPRSRMHMFRQSSMRSSFESVAKFARRFSHVCSAPGFQNGPIRLMTDLSGPSPCSESPSKFLISATHFTLYVPAGK